MISFKQFLLETNDDIDHALVKKSIDYFGITDKLSETGYMMHDGTKLDFSGRHWQPNEYIKINNRWTPKRGPDYQAGLRHVDHRDVDIDMHEFMKRTKAIRIQPGIGFETKTMPSAKQITSVVAHHNREYKGESLSVDVVHEFNGFNPHYHIFERPNAHSITKWLQEKFKK